MKKFTVVFALVMMTALFIGSAAQADTFLIKTVRWVDWVGYVPFEGVPVSFRLHLYEGLEWTEWDGGVTDENGYYEFEVDSDDFNEWQAATEDVIYNNQTYYPSPNGGQPGPVSFQTTYFNFYFDTEP